MIRAFWTGPEVYVMSRFEKNDPRREILHRLRERTKSGLSMMKQAGVVAVFLLSVIFGVIAAALSMKVKAQ